MLGLPLDTWIRLLVWLGIGLVIYFLYGRRHSVLGRRQELGERAAFADPAAR
jgi:APA family basic amino acid/polyamine antiporter